MLGFTYNGIHSSTYGCNYIPSAINKGRDMSVYTVDDIDREGADGGYYIGNEVNPRDFS
jgi:hypothetical protein